MDNKEGRDAFVAFPRSVALASVAISLSLEKLRRVF